MSLKNFIDNNKLKRETTSKDEIRELFNIVNRDINDSRNAKNLSLDWQFGIAYNAALKLCHILVRSQNLRATSKGHHYITISCLPLIFGSEKYSDAKYLDNCRKKT